MKVFIAGTQTIKTLNESIIKRLATICEKKYDILVGDCYGADSLVQKFCADFAYDKVTVFASNGKARNNLGNWNVQCVPVRHGVKGFDFYRQKDIAMAEAADCGFMIWDEKSRGTYQNIITLLEMGKMVLVCYQLQRKIQWLKPSNPNQVKSVCPK